MSVFTFEGWSYSDGVASFSYSYEDLKFTERISFTSVAAKYDHHALDRALFLSFILIGTSYYKCFPTQSVKIAQGDIDEWQANFFNSVYQEGLGQFAYENQLTRTQLAEFRATTSQSVQGEAYQGTGDVLMQSGGKDSLLLAAMFDHSKRPFVPWHVTSGDEYPEVLNDLSGETAVCKREIDHDTLCVARTRGALNGHVPVTYILSSLAVVQAILLDKQRVVAAIGHEGEEPHARIGDLAVMHQWSKTWSAELELSEYIRRYISPDIKVFSPLRRYSELRIAEMFVELAWSKYGHRFSSCNLANYKQGHANSVLTWCGECPKCANSYLLFAPFVPADELHSLFGGRELFAEESLTQTFKGLLGIDGVMKPFECVGEIDELRRAYHMAQQKGGYAPLSFSVPPSNFDYKKEYEDSGEKISE